jgi:hypothetical protein
MGDIDSTWPHFSRAQIASGLAAACLLALVTGCMAVDGNGNGQGEEYSPAATITRLEATTLNGDDIGRVRDFALIGDTIYLLDATGRIVVIGRGGSGLELIRHISRSGPGPGELLRPTGLAASAAGDLMVIDGTRLHFFSRAGKPLATKSVTLPCPMALPAVAAAAGGLFVHGRCRRQGVMADTMKSVLAWSPDTALWHTIIETPQFTTDGSMGSVFGAASLLTTGLSRTHAFGSGAMNCIWEVDDTGERPRGSEICPAALTLYTAPPPRDLERMMRSARFAGMNIRWPGTLPVYGDRFVADRDVILLRPFSADSLVLQARAPDAFDIAVAPFDGLLGCKAAGCVWLMDDSPKPRMIVLDRDHIERLLEAGR